MNEIFKVIAENPLVALIVACEVGFWVVLVAGLAVRYLLRWQKVSSVLLICVPLVDVVLLVATVIDLRGGATATAAHGLAAVYIGVSLAFGHSMIRWADQRFAHRFGGGPKPVKVKRSGAAKIRWEFVEWAKFLLAWAVACALMLGMIWMVGAPERTVELWNWMGRVSVPLVIWFAVGPVWTTVAEMGKKSEASRL